MWPRRRAAPSAAAAATSSSSSAASASGPVRTIPQGATPTAAISTTTTMLRRPPPAPTSTTNDDCGWLLRAAAHKPKAKRAAVAAAVQKAAKTVTTAVAADVGVSGGSASAAPTKTTATTTAGVKRPLTTVLKSDRRPPARTPPLPRPARQEQRQRQQQQPPRGSSASSLSTTTTTKPEKRPSKAISIPRGLSWTKPQATATDPPTTRGLSPLSTSSADPHTAETFDEVFAEIFGSGARTTTTPRVRGTAATGMRDDDPHDGALYEGEGPSLPMTSVTMAAAAVTAATAASGDPPSSSSSSQRDRGHRPKMTTRDKEASTKWRFSTPDAISLEAFDGPTAPSTTDNGAVRRDDPEFARWKAEQGRHAVSDNFVRLNMRKRFKGSTGKARKVPEYMRSRGGDYGADGRGGGFGPSSGKAKTSTDADTKTPGESLMQDGVDFIEECLEALARVEASSGALPTTTASVTTEGPNPEPAPAVDSPRCHHALVSQRLVVKKKNKNHGRAFFACPLGYDEGRCDFFMWEENMTQFALARLFSSPSTADTEAAIAPPTESSSFVPLDLSKPIAKQRHQLLTNLRLVFGHADFRPGQEWAIRRVFERKRTLLVLPTGSGKSLCYQYPALFLPGITIVISPLISLMNDQFDNLPPALKQQAVCVTTSSTSKTQYAEFVRDLLGGRLKLLFVSPEKLLTSGFQRLLRQIQSRLSLVCVDEAHCISEWSHHFRPSYLRLQAIFQHAESVLAITATASKRVEQDILAQLNDNAAVIDSDDHMASDTCDSEDQVLRMPWQRENLDLCVTRVASDEERLNRLCELLMGTKIGGAAIMYVHQQWQTEAMAALLQERLSQGPSTSAWGSATKQKIASYHANMDAEAKEKVRLGFLSGRIKLVIATIAFGMGIDKQNVRLVIHYHVPSSIEHYLQQVGRAGRDGRPARAHLFLLDDDVRTFRSLLFSNALHRSQLEKLLKLVFIPEPVAMNGQVTIAETTTTGNVVIVRPIPTSPLRYRLWMDAKWLETHVDMKSAMLETFLTLASLRPEVRDTVGLTLHPTAMSWCELHVTETKLRTADPLLQRLVGLLGTDPTRRYGHVDVQVDGYLRNLQVEFHVGALAGQLLVPDSSEEMIDIGICSRRLMQLIRGWQAAGHIQRFKMVKSALDIEIEWRHDRGDDAMSCVKTWTDLLYTKHRTLEDLELARLGKLYEALTAAAEASASQSKSNARMPQSEDASSSDDDDDSADHGVSSSASAVLSERLSAYFDDNSHRSAANSDGAEVSPQAMRQMRELTAALTPELIETIERDVRALIAHSPSLTAADEEEVTKGGSSVRSTPAPCEVEWNGYNVARVFHGLASPCFPAKCWRHEHVWRRYAHVAFEQLVVIADQVLAS